MSLPSPVKRTHLVFILLFAAALLSHAWWATRHWTMGFMPGHEFRQVQTAITTYYIDQQDNFSLLYETPIVGKPWVSILMEVPFYEWSVVGLSRAMKLPHHVAARTITLTCFYLALPAFYLLLGRLGLVPARRLLILALVLACPVYIFYSRAFLMDSMELMCCAWFLFGFVRMMDARRWYWFVLATVAGTGAALVKSATLAVWLWPAAAYVVWLLWRDLRTRAGWGAVAQTAFWGLAGVIVPLGALRWWIELTDPLKAAHPSAWIFTSANLSIGNWGLNDLGARFSPRVWSVLADRWREAVMPAWLLLALLAAGLAFLPRVRRPALALAGVFFWAQLLFPYAYAYQDYYFYSCAVFLSAGFGYLVFGLIDSRCPRWLAWPLVAVPFVAQAVTYYTGYYQEQRLVSDGGFPVTAAMRDALPRDSVIIVSGADWASMIPYYAQRKALMVRNGLENDGPYLQRAFADLADEEVTALVLVGIQCGNRFIVDRAVQAFDIDPMPTVTAPNVEVYVSRRIRDRFKQDVRAANNYGQLVNPDVAPLNLPAEPYPVRPGTAHAAYVNISPAPVRAYFQFGWGHMWVDGGKGTFAHPNSDLWIHAPGAATRIEMDFGLVAGAYEGPKDRTDGVEFSIIGISADSEREIFRRYLDPVARAADRGTQKEVIPYQPFPGEILQFSTRPGRTAGYDWAYWTRIEVK